MTDNDALLMVIDALNELVIPYTLVGSYASAIGSKTHAKGDRPRFDRGQVLWDTRAI